MASYKKCETCHARFIPTNARQKFCKDTCANRSKKVIKRYGIKPSEIHALYTRQGGKCKICGTLGDVHELGFRRYKSLHIDHAHETGEVRGLLCHSCNVGLGHFFDNEETLRLAIKYLKKARRKYHEKKTN